MASIKLLLIIVVLAVSVHAQFNYRLGFNQVMIPVPRLPFFGPRFQFTTIRLPIPTLKTIKNTIPGKGQVFNGVYTKTTSSLVRGKDGKLVPRGMTYVVTNNNGKVNEYKDFQG